MSKVIWGKIIIIFIFCIGSLTSTYFIMKVMKETNIEIKNNKETIYNLFDNFPESKNIYYTSHKLYSKWSIGPTIYQIDILAELTEESYNNFIKQVESTKKETAKIKFNPNNITYNWEKIENTTILKSRVVEEASVTEIYLDKNNKTIYIVVIAGN